MSEMIERVAKAWWFAEFEHYESTPPCEYEAMSRQERRALEGFARAAINAMRECTDDMETAGEIARDIDRCGVAWTYRAMIDAALTQESGE